MSMIKAKEIRKQLKLKHFFTCFHVSKVALAHVVGATPLSLLTCGDVRPLATNI